MLISNSKKRIFQGYFCVLRKANKNFIHVSFRYYLFSFLDLIWNLEDNRRLEFDEGNYSSL